MSRTLSLGATDSKMIQNALILSSNRCLCSDEYGHGGVLSQNPGMVDAQGIPDGDRTSSPYHPIKSKEYRGIVKLTGSKFFTGLVMVAMIFSSSFRTILVFSL